MSRKSKAKTSVEEFDKMFAEMNGEEDRFLKQIDKDIDEARKRDSFTSQWLNMDPAPRKGAGFLLAQQLRRAG